MRIIFAIATFLCLVVFVVGLLTNNHPMADVGISGFLLGSMVVGAMSLWRRHKQRRSERNPKAESERMSLSLTTELTDSVVRSMSKERERRK